MINAVKTEAHYRAALRRLTQLLGENPRAGTEDANEIEVLSVLVQAYESRLVEEVLPDPIAAIRFRMEQAGLSQRDLIPYMGSASRVSEVLAGKRPLTLSMIRALHEGLRIPAKVLLRPANVRPQRPQVPSRPVREMISREWIPPEASSYQEDSPQVFLARFFPPHAVRAAFAALPRTGKQIRSTRQIDPFALAAWTARVAEMASNNPPRGTHDPSSLNLHLMRRIARLSALPRGPLLATEFLSDHGIAVIIEQHLAGTYLDGAAFWLEGKWPVIGMTLRYDRVDHFWFTLLHEIAHIALHIPTPSKTRTSAFFDDFANSGTDNPFELEADELASEALIPAAEWKESPASNLRTSEAARHLASKLGIDPAIVVGRMHHEFRGYSVLSDQVGSKLVRKLFLRAEK